MLEVLPIGIGIVANILGVFGRNELSCVDIVSAIEQESINDLLLAINFNRYFVLVVRMVAMNKHYILTTATAIRLEMRFVVFFLAVPTFIVCQEYTDAIGLDYKIFSKYLHRLLTIGRYMIIV